MATETKAVIARLWDRLWAGGIADPLVAIEQVSYLLLLKMVDDEGPGSTAERGFSLVRWPSLRSYDDESLMKILTEELVPALRTRIHAPVFQRVTEDARFAFPKASLVRYSIETLDEVTAGAGHALNPKSVYAEVFEHLLASFGLSGRSGQFRTPRKLVDTVIELLNPLPGETVCDPAAGTAGYLASAIDHVGRMYGGRLYAEGADLDIGMVRLGAINLVLHDAVDFDLRHHDSLVQGVSYPKIDVLVSTPPFTGTVNQKDVHPELAAKTSRADLLFLDLYREMVGARGTRVAGVVVPDGVLFGVSAAHQEARRRLLTETDLQAVVALPAGLFRPHASVRTSLLLFGAGGPTERVLFCPSPLDRAGTATEEDRALSVTVAALRAQLGGVRADDDVVREHQATIAIVPLDDIETREWNLAVSTYRRQAVSMVSAGDPVELLAKAEAIEAEIATELSALRSLLGDLA